MQKKTLLTEQPTVKIQTHGCKLNFSDSLRISRDFDAAGFAISQNDSAPDVYVLNSCTVTSNADAKARQALSSARRKYPNALIVICGCYPERDRRALENFEAADLVLGNSDKDALVERVRQMIAPARTLPSLRESDYEGGQSPSLRLGRTRGFVRIQKGCDQVCAYCIVPKVRDREESIRPDTIISEIVWFVKTGCKEVVLTGTQLGSYGRDLDGGWTLARLIGFILSETDIARLRVSSLQPQELSEGLLNFWVGDRYGRLCRHFHIPLQSGSDYILGKMRRRYKADDFVDSVNRVRSAVQSCAVTTDIIVGFPGETEKHYQDTLEMVHSIKFSGAHIFPYSLRPGTSAAYFPDHVERKDKTRRASQLLGITEKHALEYRRRLIGTTASVLWQGETGKEGLSDNYVKVHQEEECIKGTSPTSALPAGRLETLRFTSMTPEGILEGKPEITPTDDEFPLS